MNVTKQLREASDIVERFIADDDELVCVTVDSFGEIRVHVIPQVFRRMFPAVPVEGDKVSRTQDHGVVWTCVGNHTEESDGRGETSTAIENGTGSSDIGSEANGEHD